ncbi:hypothetical protein, conserved [Babesia ovata]|uniref:Uncharacterized protein n=1 Tax=Babesia ovata TaxID=189622 RepID=A0A2H6KI54_9APIC|nr:uncharacterized protein BOVATA_041670 [Babesia ovata]GBE62674.1 hypothetical protein, conserved [Babesia ovata]
MVYTSLTEAPRNLKEAIDWLMALKGTDPSTNLKAMGAALYDFLVQQPVVPRRLPALEDLKRISKRFMGQKELRDHPSVSLILGRFNNPVDRKPGVFAKTMGSNPEKVADNIGKFVYGTGKLLHDIRHPKHYKSAYSSEATWAKSCSKNPETCAVIFVGIAPMLYTGLLSLRDETSAVDSIFVDFNSVQKRIRNVLNALGYADQQRRHVMRPSDILKALSDMDKDLLAILHNLAGVLAFY